MISRMYFDEANCSKGIECLRQYSRKPLQGVLDQDGKQVYSETPVHNGFSDGADAARTGAVGSRNLEYSGDVSDEELFTPGSYV